MFMSTDTDRCYCAYDELARGVLVGIAFLQVPGPASQNDTGDVQNEHDVPRDGQPLESNGRVEEKKHRPRMRN